MSWWRAAVIDLRPLRRHREFRLLFFGQLVTFFGSKITDVAVLYQVYQLTHSSLAVGMLGLAALVPTLATAFLGGAFAEAHDRRRMVLLVELAFAGMSMLLAFNSMSAAPQLWLLFLVTGVRAGLEGLQLPSLGALPPRLVDSDELTAAGALGALRGTFGMVAGPAAGGILIATLGLTATYVADVVTFAISLALLARMKAVPPAPGAARPSLRGVIEGLRYAARRPQLMGTILVDFAATLFGMPMALFPALAAHWGGPGVLGLMYSAPAAGALIASSTSGWTGRIHRHGRAVIVAAAAWGLALTVFGLVDSRWAGLALLAVAGAADMVSGIFRMAIWNQTIPDALRGRLAGLEVVTYSSGPQLGNLEAGVVATLFNVRVSVVSGGVLCVAGVVLLALALPSFRAYEGLPARSNEVA